MNDFEDGPQASWGEGPNAQIKGYRAGNLLGSNGSFATPDAVTLEDGRDGHAWLREVLPFPGREAFRYGCVRSALCAAWQESATGGWCGTVNFSKGQLYVDNQMGETGLVILGPERSCGAFASGDPYRPYDAKAAMETAPSWARPHLEALTAELATHYQTTPTAIFWTEGDRIAGAEPFHVLYAYGFEMIGETLLDDAAWRAFVEDEFGGELSPTAAGDIIDIARSFVRTGEPVRPPDEVMQRLFPPEAPGREEALRGLTDAEKFIAMLAPETR